MTGSFRVGPIRFEPFVWMTFRGARDRHARELFFRFLRGPGPSHPERQGERSRSPEQGPRHFVFRRVPTPSDDEAAAAAAPAIGGEVVPATVAGTGVDRLAGGRDEANLVDDEVARALRDRIDAQLRDRALPVG